MRRFLVPPKLITNGTVTIDGDLYRHMARVLRLQPGDEVVLCNGEGVDFHATIREIGSQSLSLDITESHVATQDPSAPPSFTLIQGLTKGDKFELIIQKSTELGIHSIVAFPATHSVVRISREQREGRISRWNKIAAEASRQSERNSIPAVTLADNLDAALQASKESVKFFLWERDHKSHLREIIPKMSRPSSVALLIGPEGGFSSGEVALAKANGFTPVSLGTRILRAETASIAMLAILQYQWGDMG